MLSMTALETGRTLASTDREEEPTELNELLSEEER
jgi:hypothetical protein